MSLRILRQMFDTVRALNWVGAGEGSHGLDYVVAGLGIGAILALIGFALWELFGDVEEPGTSWLSRARDWPHDRRAGDLVGHRSFRSFHIPTTPRGSHLVLLTTLVTLVAIAAGSLLVLASRSGAGRDQSATRKGSPLSGTIAAMAAVSGLSASDDIELTEWDSWPERSENQVDRRRRCR